MARQTDFSLAGQRAAPTAPSPLTTQPGLSAVMASDILSSGYANLKRCSHCELEKPRSEFNKSQGAKDGLQHRCRECGRALCREWYQKNLEQERARARARARVYGPKQRQANREWAAANPERARYHSRKKLFKSKYGITVEEHEAMFAAQGFSCASCGSPEPNSKKGWSTDHCHKTGVIRGILCHHCNVGIGHAKDNIGVLNMWIAYLERAQNS